MATLRIFKNKENEFELYIALQFVNRFKELEEAIRFYNSCRGVVLETEDLESVKEIRGFKEGNELLFEDGI